jgi:hypothetical protein
MRVSTSVSCGADALLHSSGARSAGRASAIPGTILRGLLPLVLGAGLSFSAQATPLVSAFSLSGAQANPQGRTSSAYVVNGVAQPGYGAGLGGSSNTGGNAFSVFADTSQLDVGANGSVQANTRVSADLASGHLRVYSEAGLGTNAAFSSQASGQARWMDTITFNNTSGQNVELDFFWNTEGSITTQRSEAWRFVTSSITLGRNNNNTYNAFPGLKDANGDYVQLTGNGAQYKYYGVDANGGDYFTFAPSGNNNAGVWRTSLGAFESGLIQATLILGTGFTAIDIDALLDVDCRNGAICDFGNTATFSFGALPTGLSWTSESGVFLTAAPPNGVPEPGSLALLAIGLVGLAVVSRGHVRVRRSCGAT